MRHYRIVRVACLHYQEGLARLYRDQPELATAAYDEQLRTVMSSSAVYSDSFTRAMRARGHAASELLYDAEILQKTWAREHGVAFTPAMWDVDIALAQLRHSAPEVVYFQDIHSLPLEVREQLPTLLPSHRLTVVFKGFPGPPAQVRGTDLLLVGVPSMLENYRGAARSVQLVYHAFDPAIAELSPSGPPDVAPFSFVGSTGYGNFASHRNRYWLLRGLMARSPLEIWGYEPQGSGRRRWGRVHQAAYRASQVLVGSSTSAALTITLADMLSPATGRKLRRLREELSVGRGEVLADTDMPVPDVPLRELFPDRCHPPVFGPRMYSVLKGSGTTLNAHTEAARGSVGNMRMFEATGVGTCLLTDGGENLAQLFAPDEEVVVYRTPAECLAKWEELAKAPALARTIAEAGHRRTMRSHTVERRCEEIDAHIQAVL